VIFGRNLDAFQGSQDILNHTLHLDGSKVVAVDSNAVPTGNFIDVSSTPFDFRTTQQIGARWNETVDLCGDGKRLTTSIGV
jgi:aldose 1-epimerase